MEEQREESPMVNWKECRRTKDKGDDERPPENWICQCRLVLSEAIERHLSTDKGFDGGFAEAQRQAINDRIEEQDQAENDEGQNEQIG